MMEKRKKLRNIAIELGLFSAVLTGGMVAAEAARAQTAAVDARSNVTIDSVVRVERSETNANGETETKLLNPATIKVVPGDALVFTNSYRNETAVPVSGFVVNNPVHQAVSLSSVEADWALVSVDGGQTFGKLSELTVEASTDDETEALTPMVTRAATYADVTNIRWIFADPIAPGETGELVFRGIVK